MNTNYFEREGKKLAYTDVGTGPTVILVPGLGDLKESYRFLVPELVKNGYRSVCLDVRGHGDSDAFWDDYSVAGVGSDLVALATHLGVEGVHVVGNSMAAGATIWASVESPRLVRSAALIGPFYRGKTPAMMKAMLGAMFWKPWGVAMWAKYYASLFPTNKPVDFDAYVSTMVEKMKRPGRLEATKAMMLASKEASGERVERYNAPSLVVMGTKDPDFKNPAQEADRIASELKAKLALVEGAGHYPQSEFPERTLALLLDFWKNDVR